MNFYADTTKLLILKLLNSTHCWNCIGYTTEYNGRIIVNRGAKGFAVVTYVQHMPGDRWNHKRTQDGQ
jgi:hypothetical protein